MGGPIGGPPGAPGGGPLSPPPLIGIPALPLPLMCGPPIMFSPHSSPPGPPTTSTIKCKHCHPKQVFINVTLETKSF